MRFGLALLLLAIIVRANEQVRENFVEAMYRLDMQNIPCAILDDTCSGSDTNLSILYLQLRPDDLFLTSGSANNNANIGQRLQLLNLQHKIFERLSNSHKILVGLVVRYSHLLRLQPRHLEEGMLEDQTPNRFAAWIASNIKNYPKINFEEFDEERLLYLLEINPKNIGPLLLERLEEGVGTCELPSWANELIKTVADDSLKDIMRRRLCGYSPQVQADIKGKDAAVVLQPLIVEYPWLAFASGFYGRMHKQTKTLDVEGHLKFLANLSLADYTTPAEELRKAYDEYLRKLEEKGKYEDICLDLLFPGGGHKRFRKEILGLVDRTAGPSWCNIKPYGMSIFMEGKEELIAQLVGKIRYPSHRRSEIYVMNLIRMGLNKPTWVLGDEQSEDHLRMNVYHRLGTHVESSISLPFAEFLSNISKELTSVSLDNGNGGRKLVEQIVKCDIRYYEELRSYLQSLRTRRPLMTCNVLEEELPRLQGQISESSSFGMEPYHSLFYEITGIPLIVKGETNASDTKKILKAVNAFGRRLTNDKSQLYGVAVAILRSGKQLINNLDTTDLNQPLVELGNLLCNDPADQIKSFSLPLIWDRLLPSNMNSCEDYKKLRGLINGDNQNMVMEELKKVPIYGKVLQELLKDPKIEYESKSKSFGFTKDGGDTFITFVNENYKNLPNNARKLAIFLPEPEKAIDWIEKIPNLNTFLETCETPAICLGQWTYFGHPMASYLRQEKPDSLMLQFEIEKETTKVVAIEEALLEIGSGYSYSSLRTRKNDVLARATVERVENEKQSKPT